MRWFLEEIRRKKHSEKLKKNWKQCCGNGPNNNKNMKEEYEENSCSEWDNFEITFVFLCLLVGHLFPRQPSLFFLSCLTSLHSIPYIVIQHIFQTENKNFLRDARLSYFRTDGCMDKTSKFSIWLKHWKEKLVS